MMDNLGGVKVFRGNMGGIEYLKEIRGSVLSVLISIQYAKGARKFLGGGLHLLLCNSALVSELMITERKRQERQSDP
jgi:hypothetical protein